MTTPELINNQNANFAPRRSLTIRSFSDPGGSLLPFAASMNRITKDDSLPPANFQARTMNPIWQLPKKYRDKKKKRQDDDRMMGEELNMVDKGLLSSDADGLRLKRISWRRRASESNIDEVCVKARTRSSWSLPSTGPLMDGEG